MKCPRCGRTNAKTNKFCRECGLRIEGLAGRDAEPQDGAETRTDEVGLGEELFRVLELFEEGDFDAAIESGEKISEANPGSASAHSIVALAYERKSQQELDSGNTDGARNYLKLAIAKYEKIIDLNPHSAADREKLATLRLKLTGHRTPPEPAGFIAYFKKLFDAVPRPVLAAFGAFVVLLALAIVLTGSGAKHPDRVAINRTAESSNRPHVSVTPSAPVNAPVNAPALSVYTFPPAAATTPPSPRPITPAPQVMLPEPRPKPQDVSPIRIPPIGNELTLTPAPKSSPAPKPAQEQPKPAEPAQPKKDMAVAMDHNSSPSGGTLLAQAIRYHDQGKLQEAIGAANQAIVLYQADIDAGRNAEAAKRGAANATKLISVWQGGLSGSSE